MARVRIQRNVREDGSVAIPTSYFFVSEYIYIYIYGINMDRAFSYISEKWIDIWEGGMTAPLTRAKLIK